MAKKKSNPVSRYLSKIGQKGGKAGKGSVKARSSEQARAAVNKRWDNQRIKNKPNMETDPTYKNHSVPVWFSKNCRAALKRAGEETTGDPSNMIQRLLVHLGLRDMWDHHGTVKRGDIRHMIMMPYVHLKREKVVEFANLIGVRLVSEDGQGAFWSPNAFLYEFAPLVSSNLASQS